MVDLKAERKAKLNVLRVIKVAHWYGQMCCETVKPITTSHTMLSCMYYLTCAYSQKG